MATTDTCCSIAPYFRVNEGKLEEFKAGCDAFIEKTKEEGGSLYYGYAFDGDLAYCREGYADGDALLAHLDNVGKLLGAALKISTIERLEIHGPKAELDKLRGPLAKLKPQFFELEFGFRR